MNSLKTIFLSFLSLLLFVALLSSCGDTFHAKKELLKNGIPYSAPYYLHAADEGDIKIVRLFLQAGMDVDARGGRTGETALLLASGRGNAKMCTFLIKHGANVNAATRIGLTPLLLASQYGYKGVVEVLIKAGANVDISDPFGLTPLAIAAQNGHIAVVHILLDAGAQINGHNRRATPLISAVGSNRLAIVKLLIKRGANVNEKTTDGQNALVTAQKMGHLRIEKFLKQNGALMPKTRHSIGTSTTIRSSK